MPRPRSDVPSQHRPVPVSRAELARRAGRSRSTITGLLSGPLAAACLPGGRVDLAHPVLVAFAERTWHLPRAELLRHQVPPSDPRCAPPAPSEKPAYERRTITLSALAAQLDEPAEHLREALASALLPPGHVGLEEFALRAGVDVAEGRRAIRAELAQAVTPAGWIDLGHELVLEFMAAHPFVRDRAGDPIAPLIDGQGYLVGAELSADDLDIDHPVARCFIARCLGRVLTGAEIEREVST